MGNAANEPLPASALVADKNAAAMGFAETGSVEMDFTKQAAMERNALRTRQRQYGLAQCAFWGAYTLFNTLFIVLLAEFRFVFLLINLILSLLLLGATHGLRALYKARTDTLSMGRVLLHLLWLIPATAITAQLVLHGLVVAMWWLLPALTEGLQPTTAAAFAGYTINTAIMLVLWSALYLMMSEFRRRRQTEIAYWRSQAQLRESELLFLRSQINSHFLFNAMNNLRALIREDPDQARDRLTQLAVLLRAILQAGTRESVPLSEELGLVAGYLALESLQFEQRLQVQWDVAEPTAAINMPPLLLQTLVENAVRHGIACRPQGGCIRIEVRQDAACVRIRISNPLPLTTGSSEGHGIGLQNARQRLQHVYGDKARLLLLPESDQMVALVEVPT